VSTRDSTAYPRLTIRHERTRAGHTTELELGVSQQPDEESREQLIALLSHAELRELEKLSFVAGLPTMPEVDFRWALDAIRPFVPRESLFISGARSISIDDLSCRRLGTANWISRFHGAFAGIRILELCDSLVELHGCVFPDLETLILRPRHAAWGVPWARKVIAAVAAFPAVREVRFPEHDGDALLAALLESPLVERLRCIDVTNNVTNAGAQLLSSNVERLANVEELWIGSGDRRRQAQRMNPAREYPRGTLEIDDAWRSRLRATFGKRLRFKSRPRHTSL